MSGKGCSLPSRGPEYLPKLNIVVERINGTTHKYFQHDEVVWSLNPPVSFPVCVNTKLQNGMMDEKSDNALFVKARHVDFPPSVSKAGQKQGRNRLGKNMANISNTIEFCFLRKTQISYPAILYIDTSGLESCYVISLYGKWC